MEYSITAEELQEILFLTANGWKCERFEADETHSVFMLKKVRFLPDHPKCSFRKWSTRNIRKSNRNTVLRNYPKM